MLAALPTKDMAGSGVHVQIRRALESRIIQIPPYLLPGACSLANHLARAAVVEALSTDKPPFEIIADDRSQNRSLESLAINPLGTGALLSPTTDG